jgi:site-specific recombinase XerD
LLRKNVDVKKVQTLLGHKNIETTLRYQHPDAEMLSEAVEGLD